MHNTKILKYKMYKTKGYKIRYSGHYGCYNNDTFLVNIQFLQQMP